jgi:hypothetical protein
MIVKHHPFFQFVTLVLLANQISFRRQKLNLFLDFLQKFLLMLSSNGRNHCSVYQSEACEYSSET